MGWRYGIGKFPWTEHGEPTVVYQVLELYGRDMHSSAKTPYGRTPEELLETLRLMVSDLEKLLSNPDPRIIDKTGIA